MPRPLRIAIIGLGKVATQRHIPSLIRQSHFELVGAIDRHAGRAAAVAKKWALPYSSQTDTLDAVSWLDSVDALLICTPIHGRSALIKEVLSKGKHVLTEKPFALTPAEGEELGHIAKETTKTLAVGHNLQFSRATEKLYADVQRGRFGPLRHVTISHQSNVANREQKWIEDLPLGSFYDDSPHHLYLMNSLAHGTLTLENSFKHDHETRETPRLIQLNYRDEANVSFSFQGIYDAPVSSWFLYVVGERAIGIVDLLRDLYIRLPQSSTNSPLTMVKTSLSAVAQHLWGHVPNGLAFLLGRLDYGNDEVIRRFAQSIQSGHPDEKIGWEKAMVVLNQQHAAIQTLKERNRG